MSSLASQFREPMASTYARMRLAVVRESGSCGRMADRVASHSPSATVSPLYDIVQKMFRLSSEPCSRSMRPIDARCFVLCVMVGRRTCW